MIKKSYYNKNYILTFLYGPDIRYITTQSHPGYTKYKVSPRDEILDLNSEFDDYSLSDLLDYGIVWDKNWYIEQSYTTLVQTPVRLYNNTTYYTNLVDEAKITIKVKASVPDEFLYTSNSFGSGITYLESRSFTDLLSFYNIATFGTPTACNITFLDDTVLTLDIPSTITDISGLIIDHNTCDCEIYYRGSKSLFLSAVGNNYIADTTYTDLVVICRDGAGTASFRYNFTTNLWEEQQS